MYGIFDLDLYLYNNIFWDTRPQRMKRIYENYYYTLKLTDYEKRNIWRIYFDIIKNMNVETMKYYTASEWMIINSMTTMLKREYKIEEPSKLIRFCNYVCEIIRLALTENVFTDRKTEDEFWLCMVELCNNTNFDLFFHSININMNINENIYFTELVNSLYINILSSAERNTDKIKFKSLVAILFYIYKRCLDNKIEIFLLEFPETTVEKIKSIKSNNGNQIGQFLLDLIDYQKKLAGAMIAQMVGDLAARMVEETAEPMAGRIGKAVGCKKKD